MLAFFEYLSVKLDNYKSVDIDEASSTIKQNNINNTMEVLRNCWTEKLNYDGEYPKSKKTLIVNSIDKIVEEVAFVFGITLEMAKSKIISTLDFKS